MLAQVNGIEPILLHNDAFHDQWVDGWQFFLQQKKRLEEERNIPHIPYNVVLSPGPGHPENRADVGFCMDAIKACMKESIPLLGVCLGHQAIASNYGANITLAEEVVHGRESSIHSTSRKECELFAFTPLDSGGTFNVVRYHSLIVQKPLPKCLESIAETDENDIVMALRHTCLPFFGLQFHPEAICSQFGFQLLQNFRDITSGCDPSACPVQHECNFPREITPDAIDSTCESPKFAVVIDKFKGSTSLQFTQRVFSKLYKDSEHVFWLDSSNAEIQTTAQSRFSMMGDASGPLAKSFEYRAFSETIYTTKGGTTYANNTRHLTQELSLELEPFRSHQLIVMDSGTISPQLPIPFGFRGGLVGYFGYEAFETLESLATVPEVVIAKNSKKPIPDVSLLFVDRTILFDHQENHIYLISISEFGQQNHTISSWHAHIKSQLQELEKKSSDENTAQKKQKCASSVTCSTSCSSDQYKDRIRKAKEYIRQGESYEICLTNQLYFTGSFKYNPLYLYEHLRVRNPAPFSAYYAFQSSKKKSESRHGMVKAYALCCTSPERFLKMDGDRWIESKPIKGTRPRSSVPQQDDALRQDLASSMKDRAENMMITDLLRNDLGSVAEIASVHVPKLMQVETYATVHQLVSTIRARLGHRYGEKLDFFDLLDASFPGGSMTGAPKRRSMQIIRELEKIPRGVYAGTLGYVSIPSKETGTSTVADFNIIIRTAVVTKKGISIGAGGAITALSEMEEEYDEMQVKAEILCKTIMSIYGQ
uniref:aminodeoxychorismate synthase n=1 Tax=Albugo laibachii Nc14 TaxID=890382 RepID=F0WQ39_9STRA|nr:paraaminobenzoate synthase putative [Albugo laibachii Nc14]|eukprot:CCA23444.1 paraaminobenzoate synthase putative [Albugo laibachii Nc14]